MLSHVRLFVTAWTRARQAPLSIGFSRQEYWSGLPFPLGEPARIPQQQHTGHLLVPPQGGHNPGLHMPFVFMLLLCLFLCWNLGWLFFVWVLFGVCVVCCFDASFSSVQFGRSVVSDSLRPHGLQLARPPCPYQLPLLLVSSRKNSPTVCKTAVHSPSPTLLILFLVLLGSVAAGSVCAAVMPSLTAGLPCWGRGEGPECSHWVALTCPGAPGTSPSRF